jgi:hypothetical protein
MTNENDKNKQKDLGWMDNEEYKAETRFIQYKLGEFIRFWILRDQPNLPGAYQPVVETLEDDKGVIYNEIKDKAGNVLDKVAVRKATWSVIAEDGSVKQWSCAIGGAKSLYGKVKSRIIEALKDKKPYLGLKIKKDGAGMKTSYDIETLPELPPKKEEKDVKEIPKTDVPPMAVPDKVISEKK